MARLSWPASSTIDDDLLRATALLQLWSEGYIEPVVPPATPRHVLAQQLLALCLQEGRVGSQTWDEPLRGLPLATTAERAAIITWLTESGHLDSDTGMLFVGPAAERRYGRKNFLELLSVFTADPEFVVLHGRLDIGSIDPMVLTRKVQGPRNAPMTG